MKFKVGDRVMCQSGDRGTVHGTVISATSKRVSMVEDGGEMSWKGPVRLFRPSTMAPPADAYVPVKWKKRDRVLFEDDKGVTQHGVVEKGGAGRVCVVYSGGQLRCTGGSRFFKTDDSPLSVDDFVDPMADYKVRSYRKSSIATDEGYPWEAKLFYQGKHIANICDAAHGGSTDFYPVAEGGRKLIQEAESKASAWFKLCGCPENGLPIELLDLWVHWCIHEKPLGITGKQHYEASWADLAERIIERKRQESEVEA